MDPLRMAISIPRETQEGKANRYGLINATAWAELTFLRWDRGHDL